METMVQATKPGVELYKALVASTAGGLQVKIPLLQQGFVELVQGPLLVRTPSVLHFNSYCLLGAGTHHHHAVMQNIVVL